MLKPLKKRVLSEIKVSKIAIVNDPCQEHALADIIKNKNSDDESGEQAGKSGVTDKGVHMSAITKSLGLPDSATEAEIEAAVAKTVADLAKSKEDLDTVTKAKETVDAALTKATADLDAKDAEITKAKDAAGDESFTDVDGETIRKSVVGGAFGALKKMNERVETAELTTFAKSNYPNIAGTPEDLVPVLRIAKSAPKADADKLHAILKAHDEIVAAGLGTLGNKTDLNKGKDGDPDVELEKMAKSRATEKNETYAVAFDAVTKSAAGQALLQKKYAVDDAAA